MSRTVRFMDGIHVAGIALLVAGAATSALGGDCHPSTPCPCAADGTCHPRRETWGTYTTRWRPWPGEQLGIQPTPAETRGEQEQQRLPKFLRPIPNQENLRGPAKPARPAPGSSKSEEPDGQAPQQPNGQEDALPVELFDIPDMGDQSSLDLPRSLQPLPLVEDGPPMLPTALRLALASQAASQPATVADNSGATVQANHQEKSALVVQPTHDSRVEPAAASTQLPQLKLHNPAAEHVFSPADESLQQAIYLEASDGSEVQQ